MSEVLNQNMRVLQVETLKLGWCKIGSDKGAKAIADLLMYNQSLVRWPQRAWFGGTTWQLSRTHAPPAGHGSGGMSSRFMCAYRRRWLSISAATGLAMREQRRWRQR